MFLVNKSWNDDDDAYVFNSSSFNKAHTLNGMLIRSLFRSRFGPRVGGCRAVSPLFCATVADKRVLRDTGNSVYFTKDKRWRELGGYKEI